jgi:hypothetical protein
VIERIKAVQRVFWTLLAVGLVVALVGVPAGNDGRTMAALEELTAFSAGFDRGALERVLLSHASTQGLVGLDAVTHAVSGRGVPKIAPAAGAPAIAASAHVALQTLDQVHALTAESAAISIGAAKPDSLGRALSWRLSREAAGGHYELQSVSLSEASCSAADLQREQDVSRAREAALRARDQANTADKKHTQAEAVYDLRRKWKATWKAISKANETRQETQQALDEAQKQLAAAEQSYETLAKQAGSFEASGKAGAAEGAAPGSECAVAVARLSEKGSGRTLELRLPAEVDRRSVAVPRITGADFPVLRSAGFWEELKDSSVAQAIERLRARFSWHYHYREISGMKVGGMTVLQLAPLLFVPLFLGLIRRSRGVGATYNPFDRPAGETLPIVGFGMEAVNLFVLVVLPFAGCVLCTWSLLQVDQVPIVPVLCAVGALALGGNSHFALKELLELRDAITRSHSNPPPAPSAPVR